MFPHYRDDNKINLFGKKKKPKTWHLFLIFTFLSDYIMILYYYKHVIENIVIN